MWSWSNYKIYCPSALLYLLEWWKWGFFPSHCAPSIAVVVDKFPKFLVHFASEFFWNKFHEIFYLCNCRGCLIISEWNFLGYIRSLSILTNISTDFPVQSWILACLRDLQLQYFFLCKILRELDIVLVFSYTNSQT